MRSRPLQENEDAGRGGPTSSVLPIEIRVYPDVCLRARCRPVKVFDGALGDLVARMLALMHTGRGVGLAGPQVGADLRLFVCNPTGGPQDDHVYINPELSDLTSSEEAEEGCLSIPDVRVNVRRAKRCRIKAFDATGQVIEAEADGLLARIWQHETDHLDGHLIIDRMNGTDQIANKKLLAQLEEDYHKRSVRAKPTPK